MPGPLTMALCKYWLSNKTAHAQILAVVQLFRPHTQGEWNPMQCSMDVQVVLDNRLCIAYIWTRAVLNFELCMGTFSKLCLCCRHFYASFACACVSHVKTWHETFFSINNSPAVHRNAWKRWMLQLESWLHARVLNAPNWVSGAMSRSTAEVKHDD